MGGIESVASKWSFVQFMRMSQEMIRRGLERSRQAAQVRAEIEPTVIIYEREQDIAPPHEYVA